MATLGDVRRAKLYYLRERHGKAAKIKERRVPPGWEGGDRRGTRHTSVDEVEEIDEVEEMEPVDAIESTDEVEADGSESATRRRGGR